MRKRSRKKLPGDRNALAAYIIEEATGGSVPTYEADKSAKNPAAVALGRLGGLKGGKARARKLSPQQRSDSARKAARARWQRQS